MNFIRIRADVLMNKELDPETEDGKGFLQKPIVEQTVMYQEVGIIRLHD